MKFPRNKKTAAFFNELKLQFMIDANEYRQTREWFVHSVDAEGHSSYTFFNDCCKAIKHFNLASSSYQAIEVTSGCIRKEENNTFIVQINRAVKQVRYDMAGITI